jgi:hypothetical protein
MAAMSDIGQDLRASLFRTHSLSYLCMLVLIDLDI